MFRRDLQEYLDKSLAVEKFQRKIAMELSRYKNGLEKKGSSVEIRLDGDKGPLNVSQYHFEDMQKDFIDGRCDEYFLAYVSDALLLSENTVFER